MWSQEDIQKNLDDGKLPCGRCHKWKESKTEFGKYSNGKQHKVCKECNKSWKDSYANQKQKVKETIGKKDDCIIT